MGIGPTNRPEDLQRLLYCPACGTVWAGTNLAWCWCEMRPDVPEGASPWEQHNYPLLVLFPDQAAALATLNLGGAAALEAVAADLVARASSLPDADSRDRVSGVHKVYGQASGAAAPTGGPGADHGPERGR